MVAEYFKDRDCFDFPTEVLSGTAADFEQCCVVVYPGRVSFKVLPEITRWKKSIPVAQR